ncbi:MAG: hypothetical protein AAGJ55_00690 [Cyanobacteria bacterium J06555_12]
MSDLNRDLLTHVRWQRSPPTQLVSSTFSFKSSAKLTLRGYDSYKLHVEYHWLADVPGA